MSKFRGTKRKRSSSAERSSSAYKTIKLDCGAGAGSVDDKFLIDIKASLTKAKERKECKYDNKGKQCYQKNPEHIASFSHKHHYGADDIALFKKDTDRFLENTYNIYACNKYEGFSQKWYIEIGARRGEEGAQIYTAIYNEYHSLNFFILANVILHVEDYVQKYGKMFLLNMFQSFESSDNTGLFDINPASPIGKKFTEYATKERDTQQIDYRLGNTTISDIIQNEKIPDPDKESMVGGKRKRRTNKRSNNKRSNNKRSNNKRRTNKRSNNKRSNNKRSNNKRSNNKRKQI